MYVNDTSVFYILRFVHVHTHNKVFYVLYYFFT